MVLGLTNPVQAIAWTGFVLADCISRSAVSVIPHQAVTLLYQGLAMRKPADLWLNAGILGI
jgi:hypothetical protein